MLGTNSAREVETRVLAGDPEATLVAKALAYQVTKILQLIITSRYLDILALRRQR